MMLKRNCQCGMAMGIVDTEMDVAPVGSETATVPVKVWKCPECGHEELLSADTKAIIEDRPHLPGF